MSDRHAELMDMSIEELEREKRIVQDKCAEQFKRKLFIVGHIMQLERNLKKEGCGE